MATIARCPNCGQLYRLQDELLGKRFACRKCGEGFMVTAEEGVQSAPLAVEVIESEPTRPAPTRKAKAGRKAKSSAVASNPVDLLLKGLLLAAFMIVLALLLWRPSSKPAPTPAAPVETPPAPASPSSSSTPPA